MYKVNKYNLGNLKLPSLIVLDLIKNNRIATAIVLFSGLVFTLMTQLNWLYLVRNDNFEKNEENH